MSYKFACFISYKRPPQRVPQSGIVPRVRLRRHYWDEFAESFEQELNRYLILDVLAFRGANLAPGTLYPKALSESLCRSLCLVALVVPQYFESAWCIAEWNAMLNFEATRLPRSQKSLIFPVVLGGDPSELQTRFGGRKWHDFRSVNTPARQLANSEHRQKIRLIADEINSLGDILKNLSPTGCDQFSLGLGPDSITPIFLEPSPLMR
jgi:TIR domain